MALLEMDTRIEEGGVAVLALRGRLNVADAADAKAEIKRLVARGYARLVLDLGGLEFIDSSGLAAFVAGYKAAAEAGGRLYMAAMSEQVAGVFSLTRLDRVFPTYPDLAAARAAILAP